MAYERVNWENLPSTKTPVNADNLNKMDEGIKDLETELSKKANSSDVYTKAELDTKLNYSTNEQKIGKWIDGKPLYRKVIESTTFTTSPYPVSSNIKQFINQYGYVQRKDYPDASQFINSRVGTNMSIQFLASDIYGGIQIDWGSSWKENYSTLFNKIIIIVEYTKTTD